MSGTRAISTTSRRELSSYIFFLQGKAPREIHSILTKNYLVSFLVGVRTYQHPCISPQCYKRMGSYSEYTKYVFTTLCYERANKKRKSVAHGFFHFSDTMQKSPPPRYFVKKYFQFLLIKIQCSDAALCSTAP